MQSFDAYGNDKSKSGFWGVLAQKAKSILDDNNSPPQHESSMPQALKSHSFNTFTAPAATQVIIIYNLCSMQCRKIDFISYICLSLIDELESSSLCVFLTGLTCLELPFTVQAIISTT